MDYEFEKIENEDMYQVRLGGEFITYSSEPNPEKIDAILRSRGYVDREEFYNERIQRAFDGLDKSFDELNKAITEWTKPKGGHIQ